MVSERFSFKGWDFKTWVTKNSRDLKLILSGTVGIVSALVLNLPPKWSVPLGMIITYGTKLLVDTFDYWQME